jgi:thiol-disulfide isomerase/thioredoxin
MLTVTAMLMVFSQSAWATLLQVDIDGLSCVDCQNKVVKALDELSGLSNTQASTAAGLACTQATPSPAEQACANIASVTAANACTAAAHTIRDKAVLSAIADLNYTVTGIREVDTCDLDKHFPDNWADTEGLDAVIISRGERVDLDTHRAPEKFTIFDFGAPWCAPCHAAETLLKVYLRDHTDVALRAIVLDSQDPKVSYAMPVVSQHLLSAPGLPYFIVMSPEGDTIARGVDVPKLLRKLDRKR